MDRGQVVKVRGNCLYLDFYYQNIRQRPSLGLEDTKPNRLYAERLYSAIQHEIAIGTFDFAKHFPNRKNKLLVSNQSNKTVSQALDEYLKASKRRLEKSTFRDYHSAIESHLKPQFGHLRLVDVTSTLVKGWIAELTISPKRINNILVPIRAVFEDAYLDEVIDRNPFSRIKNLSFRTEEPQPFTPEEVKAILKALPEQGRNLIQFAFCTGLRTSELIALEWGDIDWINLHVRVSRASVNKVIKHPKTISGERDVKLFQLAIEALNNQKKFTFMKGERIFNNPRTNTPWEGDGQIRKTLWQPALKKAGVIYRKPYQTRHTYASTLLSMGANQLWLANQMGHKDWGMIRKHYGRWIPAFETLKYNNAFEGWTQFGHMDIIND